MPHREHPIWLRFQARKTKHKTSSLIKRAVTVALGTTFVIAGIILAPLPGPGATVLVPPGLMLLALEFKWAEWALSKNLSYLLSIQRRAATASRAKRVFGVLAITCAGCSISAFVLLWGFPFSF